MSLRALGVLLSAVLGATLVVAPAAAAAVTPSAVDFSGTVALSDCSGALVKVASASAGDPALVLSNGHCYEGGFPAPGQVLVDRPSTRTFGLLSADGQQRLATLRATKLAYATMTDTDVSLYQLSTTYGQIQQQYGIGALEIAAVHPAQGTAIKVVSGYWKKIYSCDIDGFVYRLKEADWISKDSIRYTPSCDTIGGTSGSPIVDAATGKVIGVNNTGNEAGERCTENNPCEIDQNGTVTVRQGINYGQQTYLLAACMTGSRVDLTLAGCQLPKPAR
ncbi:MAG: trypsin-like peptidase domain-containing protein [Kutzneria sp.]|nr:trypsin-like peptidase domain-containing protein [Kutzneria sp.]MBV9843588.1 trypsin-like peptidase domain-containing protein [Kutzneria sp.]